MRGAQIDNTGDKLLAKAVRRKAARDGGDGLRGRRTSDGAAIGRDVFVEISRIGRGSGVTKRK